jgi:excinuclease ABC subunit A
MSKSSARSVIRLRGVRHNNLKNFDLDLPLHRLIVITGLSGSGKSSLAFDTLFAEGQRRYIETFSPYARQFFDRMDKPRVDSIEGIPPAIAVEQRNAVRTTRSTIGTMTEICDYMKVLWPHIARLHCRQCRRPVRKDSPQQIWDTLIATFAGSATPEVLVTFDVPLSQRVSVEESLALVAKQGFQRLLLENQPVRLDDPRVESALRVVPSAITILQDRLKLASSQRARFIEACEQAYHFGKGRLAVHEWDPAHQAARIADRFSNRLHCARCDIEYPEPTPALFSFNHPSGACPSCHGFGRMISIDYDLALPDRSKRLSEGVVKPWLTGHGIESQQDLIRACRKLGIPTDVPFEKLSKSRQNLVIEGEPDYGKDAEHEWPRAWYGVKGYFRWLESKAYKMHVRVLLSRYRAYTTCPECGGARFRPETLLYRADMAVNPKSWRMSPPPFHEPQGRNAAFMRQSQSRIPLLPAKAGVPFAQDRKEQGPAADPGGAAADSAIEGTRTLADFYALPVRDALAEIERLSTSRLADPAQSRHDPVSIILSEVRLRLNYLNEVGLGYLTLDRPTRSLSGGETERVNLTTCLGTRLVNTLFVLDEPSVGLHPRDTERLVRILEQLRDAGNTVVVVEHEASVIRAADRIVDLGPGHGATGGQVVFEGTYGEILKSRDSITGQYLSGRKRIEIPHRRPVHPTEVSRPRRPAGQGGRDYGAMILQEAAAPMAGWERAGRALRLSHAARHNLKDITVDIPLGRFVCITGVSGSGKTTLMREVLLPVLESHLKSQVSNLNPSPVKASERIEDEGESAALVTQQAARLSGWENLGRAVLVDQSILGKTPRSNPAVYIGAFDHIREFYAQSEPARRRGLGASAFSFNSPQGQCERCRGAGFEKIEMQFLSDVFIRCPDCGGRRYRQHIVEVRVTPDTQVQTRKPDGLLSRVADHTLREWSIADMLDATVDEAVEFLGAARDSRPAQRAVEGLKLLQEVGLGYLRLGQPINTLSGGESQRLKLVRHLAEAVVESSMSRSRGPAPDTRPTLFLFDEPTTGLHFEDVRVLLEVFQRLVDAGHSVLVVEHNLDVIKSADWVIDLGPGAGDEGGSVVAQGTPEEVARCDASHTGRYLRDLPGARSLAPPASADSTGAGGGRERAAALEPCDP